MTTGRLLAECGVLCAVRIVRGPGVSASWHAVLSPACFDSFDPEDGLMTSTWGSLGGTPK